MAGVVVDVESTVWAYTTTTTITSTVTGTPGGLLYLEFPAATTTQPLSYTDMPRASDGKEYPTPLPILVLTQYDAVVVDSTGSIIETQTVIQSPPPVGPTLPAGYDPGTKVYLSPPIWGWGGWSRNGQAAFCVALALMLLVIAATSVLLWIFARARKTFETTYEQDYKSRQEKKTEAERQGGLLATR